MAKDAAQAQTNGKAGNPSKDGLTQRKQKLAQEAVGAWEDAAAVDGLSKAAAKHQKALQKHGKHKHRRCGFCCGLCNRTGFAVVMAMIAIVLAADKYQDNQLRDKVVQQVEHLNVTQFEVLSGIKLPAFLTSNDTVRPGLELLKEGYEPHYPIVIIPGFITSGLELWKGLHCAKKYFRQRVWGSMTMTQQFLMDTQCWLQHLTLNATDGLDPDEVKLRASTGLEAVDYFMPGYHVWAKMIEAFADLGYDSNNLIGETYDWRLSVPNMEYRDGYYTRLKARFEVTKLQHGRKVMAVSHSWGDNVFRNFFHWVEDMEKGWTEKYIATYVNIAGPVLGVPKSMTALLSGETRDTAELGLLGTFMSNHFIPQQRRAELFRTWGSIIGMLPAGGPAIWGNHTWAPDDTEDMIAANATYGTFFEAVSVSETVAHQSGDQPASMAKHLQSWVVDRGAEAKKAQANQVKDLKNIDEAVDVLLEAGSPNFRQQVRDWAAVHTDECSSSAHKGDDKSKYYFNPLKCPLPEAPSMRMYCFYGVGKPAERAYHYLHMQEERVEEKHIDQAKREVADEMHWKINTEVSHEQINLDHGVRKVDGDGTVPLISSGLLCRHPQAWAAKSRLNPSGIPVVTREYMHEPSGSYMDLRGGPRSADHVDILAHVDLMVDILKVAAGAGDELDNKIVSQIDRIVSRTDLEADL
uniref:Phospholipid: diacylglycerol acyltransferase n=1 Tax=Lobosphaera incisa TaxID=312850 RepID=A0A173GQ96_9CHLO|nr:phospholipid: diacylglycerol acyltransferase [Lobosphaera incisa]ANH79231.1 phospholipid:diacylglycerol acyltransferase [Lobosphaera incisa]